MKKLLPIVLFVLAFTACSKQEATGPNADTVLDDQIFTQATASIDLARCEQISDADRQEECKMVVESLLITVEAQEALDVSLCDDISDERYRENCKNLVNGELEQQEAREKTLAELQAQDNAKSAIEERALNEGDPKICDEIEDRGQKYACRYNIITNQALEKNDPALCEEIGEAEYVGLCQSAF